MNPLFFEKLTGFTNFEGLAAPENYHAIPKEWILILTDVKGSTKAIEAGRYKEVNTVGAATLAALKNAVGAREIPFVFGGDGATAVIPFEDREAVIRELAGLKNVAREKFNLELRTGMITIEELEKHTGPVMVGKYILEGGYALAVFMGGALAMADELVKNSGDRYEIDEHLGLETDLRRLSCRWQALETSNGVVASLLIFDPQQRHEVYQEILCHLEEVTNQGFAQMNPLRNRSRLKYRGLIEMLRSDSLHQLSSMKKLHRQFESVAAFLLFRLGLYRLVPSFKHYMGELDTHSDFRKFDDMLRMVIDCSPDQLSRMRDKLQVLREEYGICYGIHESQAAMMTCYTPSFADGGHVHFIDGSNGGYAMAAKQLKAQIKEGLIPN